MGRVVSLVLPVVLFACVAPAGEARAANYLKGDYVEARTASVFAGACHYNGEVTTAGRDAVLAWNVREGRWGGTDMAGVRAVAVVTSESNLSEAGTRPRYELVVDGAATKQQADALVSVVQSLLRAERVSVKRAPVAFAQRAENFLFDAPGFASLSVRALPDKLCCKMPHTVWYSPLVRITNRRVGHTAEASYAGGALGDPWSRLGENSAFYGSFSL